MADQAAPDPSSLSKSFNKAAKTPDEKSAAALTQALKSAGQFTVLGDTDHGSMRMMQFLARDATMKGLRDAGVKNMFLEVRHEYQPLADAVAAGKMTATEYAQKKYEMARDDGDAGFTGPSQRDIVQAAVIQAAARHGIRIHCAEKQAAGLKEHGELVDTIDHLTANVWENTLTESQKGMGAGDATSHFLRNMVYQATDGRVFGDTPVRNYAEAVTPLASNSTPLMQDVADMRKEYMSQRIAGDAGLAEFVRERAGKEKSVVFYGSLHGATACDVDEFLQAPRVNLFPDKVAAARGLQAAKMMGEQLPALSIDLATGDSFTRAQALAMTLPTPVLPEDKRINACKAPATAPGS